MSSEWREVPVAEVTTAVTKGTTPTTLGYAFQDYGVRFVKVETLTEDGRFLEDKFAFISEEANKALLRSQLQDEDILFTIAGTIGRTGIVKPEYLPANTNQAVAIVRPNKNLVEPRFLRYVLSNPSFTRSAQSKTVQSVQANFSLGELKKATFHLPPLKRQRSIVSILGALDDRITLLRETNATLEAIAQALFKSWFVDFDPVRARMEGRTPEGMNEATAALFPDSFEEKELGAVPRGWRVLPLAEVMEINPTRKLKKGELAPYLDMASVGTQGHVTDAAVPREMGSGSKFVNGDTLLARITPCLENGKTAFVDFLSEEQTGWGSTEFVVLRPKAPLPDYFAYLLCRHDAFREFAIQSMSGTSGRQRIQNDVLGRYLVPVPTKAVAEAFGQTVSALQQRIAANHANSQTLATLRDTLLPRLISGQLRLAEAQAEQEDALA